jgi:hypothetical protein
MSNQIQNPNVKIFSKTISYLSVNTQVVWFTGQGLGLFQFSSVNLDELVKSRKTPFFVIPAKAGIQ